MGAMEVILVLYAKVVRLEIGTSEDLQMESVSAKKMDIFIRLEI